MSLLKSINSKERLLAEVYFLFLKNEIRFYEIFKSYRKFKVITSMRNLTMLQLLFVLGWVIRSFFEMN